MIFTVGQITCLYIILGYEKKITKDNQFKKEAFGLLIMITGMYLS